MKCNIVRGKEGLEYVLTAETWKELGFLRKLGSFFSFHGFTYDENKGAEDELRIKTYSNAQKD